MTKLRVRSPSSRPYAHHSYTKTTQNHYHCGSPIADQQRQLILTATLLMSTIVLPVLILTFGIAWRYRASNHKARYSPELAGNRWAETIWWLVPFAIIVVLAGIVIVTSHSLDPSKPLVSDKKPIRVQVISLQWKWLFLYPDLHVASVNYLPVPVNTPIDFELTSDAPMNSFWVPQLGGRYDLQSTRHVADRLQRVGFGDSHI